MADVPSTEPESVMKTYFPALTGLRAVAAFSVFAFHAALSIKAAALPPFLRWPVYLAQQANTGVSIFFVLSGFLITLRYAASVELTRPWLRRYFQNRFARIYPIYFLLTFVTFAAMLVRPSRMWYEWPDFYQAGDKFVAIFFNLTLLRAFFNEFKSLGIPTAWTLTVEETFYLCAPLLLMGLKRYFRLIYFYPLVFLSIGGLMMGFCSRFWSPYGLLDNAEFMLFFTFFGRCVEFLAGMRLAFWVAPRLPNGLSNSRPYATIAGGLGIFGCLVAHTIMAHMADDSRFVYPCIFLDNFLLPVPIAVFLAGLIRENTMLKRVLETKTFQLLGKSSYIFYLVHLGVVDRLFTGLVTTNWLARLLAYGLFSIALYKWVEHPMQRWLRAKPRSVPTQAELAGAA